MEGFSKNKNNNEIEKQKDIKSFNVEIPEKNEVAIKTISKETEIEKENSVNSKKDEILKIFNKKIDPSIEKKNDIKEGVDFVFKQNPELEKIGTREQYSEYLDTIFPDSKVKDILWHKTNNKFDEFDLKYIKDTVQGFGFYFSNLKHGKESSNTNPIDLAVVINTKNYFKYNRYGDPESFVKEAAKYGRKILPYIKDSFLQEFNIDKENISDSDAAIMFDNARNGQPTDQVGSSYEHLLDEFFNFNDVNSYRDYVDRVNKILGIDTVINYDPESIFPEYVVTTPEQIHILGSQKDLENFKKFVEKENDTLNSEK